VVLDGSIPPDRANRLVGGKSAATDRLICFRFPVPPAAAVTTAAYRQAASTPQVRALLARLVADPEIPDEEVDAAFLEAALDPDVQGEILQAARVIRTENGVAARSSATVEDLAGTSFAGQYRSFLNLRTDADVLRAVRLVWASLWHAAPRAYRRASGVDEGDIAMGVLLMGMIPSVEAGVAFTRDPGGRRGVRVESVRGLGEQLVSGEVTPQAWVVDDDNDAPGEEPPPEVVREVARTAAEIERAFSTPMDVEWAWDGQVLWIVQARPITVGIGRGDGFDTAVDDRTLTTAGIAEMLPGVLPPRTWELAGLAVEEALRRSVDSLGAMPSDLARPYGFIRRVRGRAALDLDALKTVAEAAPGGAAEEVESQYFGAPAADSTQLKRRSRWSVRELVHDVRVLRARRMAITEADIAVEADAELARRAVDPARLVTDDLYRYRRRLVALGMRAMSAEVAIAAAAAAAFRRLELTIAGHLGDEEATVWVQRVTTGVPLPVPRTYASMSVFGGPTWAEADVVPDARIPQPSSRVDDLRQLEATLQALPKWRATRIMTGQVVDVRIHVVRRLVDDAVAMLGRRERTKAAVLGIGGRIRAVDLELGRRLVAAGSLPRPEDVDLLAGAELLGARPLPPPVELSRRRRWIQQCDEDGPLPERFAGLPEPLRSPIPSGDAMSGTASSPGRYTARARVVRSPIRSAFRDGEVLVAEATDAGWSPLFLHAGAIVVERGGPLSHAAIVARELGVPAVLDVPGATSRLDGHVVTVDGDLGTVTVHPDRERDGDGDGSLR
jgi:rifampicin phosphotransferase